MLIIVVLSTETESWASCGPRIFQEWLRDKLEVVGVADQCDETARCERVRARLRSCSVKGS
jgi:hypothetical protein